ncbi:glycerol-3-phosphate 1-O-acyltransferase PlsY [Pseudomonas sp.]|uniref:glycerol-3-phosphate 1-O-acyltransferase PlsY n=1 Tax=Pseudomonas sp. TaxID=306 RepID=UPI00272C7AE3|nr:glycerol-3-phosphate 1-O-acyltransferase PlsY [Pseudomonas sp.]
MSAELATLFLTAYLLGSVSFALVLSRLGRLPDPRAQGSGNPGASNVLRLGGRALALATLIGDVAKGCLAVWLAAQAGLSPFQQAWVGMAAVIGHMFPLFHRFHGGKGVATTAGVLLLLSWPALLIGALLWGLTFAIQRTASLASLIASLGVLPWLAWHQPELIMPIGLMVLLIMLRHRLNILRLLAGTENRFRR